MLEDNLDIAVVVCRLQSLWKEAACFPAHESARGMQYVLKELCSILGAADASWVVMNRGNGSDGGVLSNQYDPTVGEMKGWAPVAGMYLNPDKDLKRVAERWFMHARKNGIDPLSREVANTAGAIRVCTREDVATDEEWWEHWMCTKFLAYFGMAERMIGVVPMSEHCECCVVLDRPLQGKPFSQLEKRYFHLAISGLDSLHRSLCLEHGLVSSTSPLSQRERETYRHLLTSMSEAEIAEKMGLSAHTVHDYARKLYKKFNVRGRVGLMAMVLAR